MADLAKPSGGCADCVLAGGVSGQPVVAVTPAGGDTADVAGAALLAWPAESETAYDDLAVWADGRADDAQGAAHQAHILGTHADTEANGASFDAAADAFGVDATKFVQSADNFTNMAAWLRQNAAAIRTAKSAIISAVDGHQTAHDAPLKKATGSSATTDSTALTQAEKDADRAAAVAKVTAAGTALETNFATAEAAVAMGALSGAIPGPTEQQAPPPLPDRGNVTDTPPPNAPAAPGGLSTPPDGVTTPGGPGTSDGLTTPGGPATPLDPSVFAAPPTPNPLTTPPAATPESASPGMTDPSQMMSGMPASMGVPSSAGSPSGQQSAASPGGGSPVSSPSSTGASPLVDSLGKLADGAATDPGSEPLTADRLEELIKEAGLGESASVDADGDGIPDSRDDVVDADGDGKPDPKVGATPGASPGQSSGPDPYTPANTNPALNNPPAPQHLVAPSPAAPVTTDLPPRATVSAPITELSHDLSLPGGSAVPPVTGLSHDLSAPGANPNPNTGGGQGNNGSPVLGPYPNQAGTPISPMAPMSPMAPLSGLATPPANPVSASPVLAAAVPPAVEGAARVAGPGAVVVPPRVAALAPEFALAEAHVASLVRVFTAAGWAGTVLAVAVVDDGSGAPRYVLATSDGLSLVPMGVAVPAGIELLEVLCRGDESFLRDWGGYRRAARKLVTWAESAPGITLRYLVSCDTGTPVCSSDGRVVEAQQSAEEGQRLSGGSAAITPRYQIPGLLLAALTEDRVAALVDLMIRGWGCGEVAATDMASAKARVMGARWTDIRDRDPNVPAITATYLAAEALAALAAGRWADAAASLAFAKALTPYNWEEMTAQHMAAL